MLPSVSKAQTIPSHGIFSADTAPPRPKLPIIFDCKLPQIATKLYIDRLVHTDHHDVVFFF